MIDYIALFGFILIGTIVMTWVYDLFETVYWKYIDWKYSEEKDQ
jgi:hypothetical protein